MELTLDHYRWLVDDDAKPWLFLAAEYDGSLVSLAEMLRRFLTVERTHLVLEQTELRRRGRAKFNNADCMFFTDKGLQQATGQAIGEYKSSRFEGGQAVADLCCGIGGDLLALATNHPVTGIDCCGVAALLARENCRALGLEEAEILGESVRAAHLEKAAFWHIDPDRRADGQRASQIESYDPGESQINQLLQVQQNGAVKLAPAARVPRRWMETSELEWISDRRECKQLVAWFGDLMRRPAQRVATQIDQQGKTNHLVGKPGKRCPVAQQLGAFICEPDPAVLAAHLTGELAAKHQLYAVSPNVAYFTTSHLPTSPLLSIFEVIESLPFDLKRVRSMLRRRRAGQIDVKKRGVDVDPATLAKRLSAAGDQRGTVFIMPHKAKTIAILARRVCGSNQ